jgi:uncharacterized protein YdeI (YjbR/CyaY-like superfamily)
MQIKDKETFCPTSRIDWRKWLKTNHSSKQSIWLVCYKKKTNIPTISWDDAVSEALCFGWIDSIRKNIDDEKFIQFFSPRKPKGTWSKVNKEKITHLITDGLMTKAGYASIENAKQNGSWAILDEVEELIIPKDLLAAFKTKAGSKKHFLGLSKSVQKLNLQWLVSAKKQETRVSRIQVIVALANKK